MYPSLISILFPWDCIFDKRKTGKGTSVGPRWVSLALMSRLSSFFVVGTSPSKTPCPANQASWLADIKGGDLSWVSAPAYLLFVCCRSLLSPVWTEMKRLQGKLQQSKLVRLSSSLNWLTVSLADTLLSGEASQSVRYKQLISSYRHHQAPRSAA